MSAERTQKERNKVVEEFCEKLKTSGYNQRQVKEIVESGLIGYSRRISRQGGVRHRRGENTKAA